MSFTDPSDLVDWHMVHLRRWRDQGVEPHYIVPFSEPSHNQGGRLLSPVYMRELIRGLGRKLVLEGFRTKIVAPDDINPHTSYKQLEAIMGDAEVRDYVAVISTHLYDGHIGELARIRDRFARPFKKALWMGEYFRGPGGLNGGAFDYAELMHDLIWTYDVSLVNYEWAYFGQWEDSRNHWHRTGAKPMSSERQISAANSPAAGGQDNREDVCTLAQSARYRREISPRAPGCSAIKRMLFTRARARYISSRSHDVPSASVTGARLRIRM